MRFADEAPLSPSAVAGRPADASAGQRHDGNGRLGALAAPAYPGAAYAAGQSGQVVVLVNVDARGLPTQVEVERSEPAGVFDAATLEAARRWRFTPARRAGQAVASRVRVPVTFVLESSAAEAPAASQGVPDGIEG
ncbi:energy transducer TonB [Xanthomonas sp. Kuri4-2]